MPPRTDIRMKRDFAELKTDIPVQPFEILLNISQEYEISYGFHPDLIALFKKVGTSQYQFSLKEKNNIRNLHRNNMNENKGTNSIYLIMIICTKIFFSLCGTVQLCVASVHLENFIKTQRSLFGFHIYEDESRQELLITKTPSKHLSDSYSQKFFLSNLWSNQHFSHVWLFFY